MPTQAESNELEKLVQQYKRAQNAGDSHLLELSKNAVQALARREAAAAEMRLLATFINDA